MQSRKTEGEDEREEGEEQKLVTQKRAETSSFYFSYNDFRIVDINCNPSSRHPQNSTKEIRNRKSDCGEPKIATRFASKLSREPHRVEKDS